MNVNDLLQLMVKRNISDIHFKAGSPPMLRFNGKLMAAESSPLTGEHVEQMAYSLMNEKQQKKFEKDDELDLGYEVEGVSRFRVNLYRQKGGIALSLRVIPPSPKTFEELNLPNETMRKLTSHNRGLILIAGITGAGKTTTLNTMIDFINSTRRSNIITIEDPVEFYHNDKMSTVSQREVGTDTKSFGQALKHVLRQDPDVIVIGEMRDFETVNAAIMGGETGHLVISTVHTIDAVHTVNRIVDMYSPHQQAQIRMTLSQILRGIIAQRLIPRVDQEGRIPAIEILTVTPFVRKLIAEGKDVGIYTAMQQGTFYGMQSFDQSLLNLYKEGKISLEEALDNATNPDELMLSVRGIYTGVDENNNQGKRER